MSVSGEEAAPGQDRPVMDAAFIERHQIVERYLAGKLPAQGAVDFERWCRENPQLVEGIGLPDRVNAALKLMEAAGRPTPWAERVRRFYENPWAFFGALLACAIAIGVAFTMNARTREAERQQAVLEQRVADRPLLAVSETRPISVQPSRTGPSRRASFTLPGRSGQLADLAIDVSWSRATNFRVLLDRIDQGRVAVFANQVRDSNGALRLALNSSALGPGDYQLTLEALDWRGKGEPQAWVTFSISP